MGNMCAQSKVSEQLRPLCHEELRDSYRKFGVFFWGEGERGAVEVNTTAQLGG
jgi:hypothetical protein